MAKRRTPKSKLIRLKPYLELCGVKKWSELALYRLAILVQSRSAARFLKPEPFTHDRPRLSPHERKQLKNLCEQRYQISFDQPGYRVQLASALIDDLEAMEQAGKGQRRLFPEPFFTIWCKLDVIHSTPKDGRPARTIHAIGADEFVEHVRKLFNISQRAAARWLVKNGPPYRQLPDKATEQEKRFDKILRQAWEKLSPANQDEKTLLELCKQERRYKGQPGSSDSPYTLEGLADVYDLQIDAVNKRRREITTELAAVDDLITVLPINPEITNELAAVIDNLTILLRVDHLLDGRINFQFA